LSSLVWLSDPQRHMSRLIMGGSMMGTPLPHDELTRNLSLNHLSRYRSRWSFFSELFAGREEDDDQEPEFADESMPDVLEQRERSAWVEQALQKLPTAQRVPLVLYHIEGFSYEEIAAKLGVSLGKVKTDIFRARENLRRKLRLLPGLESRLN
jgi:RNA polymerase sigma factor (sigma-70 family)